MTKSTWDRVQWTVTDGDTILNITTEGGVTWALRALRAAGSSGLHPIDTDGGRWASLVKQLRDLGVTICDLLPDHNGRLGFVLACKVQRSEETAI
jgi:hypothetical protein